MTSANERQIAGDHYKKHGQYQPWDVLQAWLTPEEYRGWQKGVVIVYLARERDKGGDQDIMKAGHHIEKLVEVMTKNATTAAMEQAVANSEEASAKIDMLDAIAEAERETTARTLDEQAWAQVLNKEVAEGDQLNSYDKAARQPEFNREYASARAALRQGLWDDFITKKGDTLERETGITLGQIRNLGFLFVNTPAAYICPIKEGPATERADPKGFNAGAILGEAARIVACSKECRYSGSALLHPAYILQALGVEVSPEWINYLEEPITMKTETEWPLAEQPDTLAAEDNQSIRLLACALAFKLGVKPDEDTFKAIEEALELTRLRGYNRGTADQQLLIEETVAQAEGMRTSIIRATVAAVMEVIRNGTAGAGEFNSHSITMNLEAQRTIWDRYELTTERDESQENVTFTIHKK